MRKSFKGLQLGCLSYLQFSAALWSLVSETYHQEASFHILGTLVPSFASYMLEGGSRSCSSIRSWKLQSNIMFGRTSNICFFFKSRWCVDTNSCTIHILDSGNTGPFWNTLVRRLRQRCLCLHGIKEATYQCLWANCVAPSQSSPFQLLHCNRFVPDMHACTLFGDIPDYHKLSDQLTWWLPYNAESLYTGNRSKPILSSEQNLHRWNHVCCQNHCNPLD